MLAALSCEMVAGVTGPSCCPLKQQAQIALRRSALQQRMLFEGRRQTEWEQFWGQVQLLGE